MGLLAQLLGIQPPPEADYETWMDATIARTGTVDARQGAQDGRDQPYQHQYALVGGVLVDLASPEYAAWYAEYYG